MLVRQNNVGYSVTLHQKNEFGQFEKTGVCKVNDGYENYYDRQFHYTIPIDDIINHLPKLIEVICIGEANSLIALLPDNNKRLSSISITNVQDLCTALEREYELKGYESEKDALIQELKKTIKATIKCFLETYREIDIYKETTINSSFKYLDNTLSGKIQH